MSVIDQRLREFKILGAKGYTTFDFKPFLDLKIEADLKTELAFCISTANSSAVSGLFFQKSLEGLDTDTLDFDDLEALLRNAKVRFYGRKAEYIRKAWDRFEMVEDALKFDDRKARAKLLKVKGLGLKEASHFLRNVGRKDVAIIDRHVLRWLFERGYIDSIPKNLNRKLYLELEEILKRIASKDSLNLAELDLRIWYSMTGRVLK